MKKLLFFVCILLVTGCKSLLIPTNNYSKWVECLENSEYSDSECEECDYLYNKSGKFRLDNFEIDLPEEITQVTEIDTLKGYFNNKGVLVIEFNNARNN